MNLPAQSTSNNQVLSTGSVVLCGGKSSRMGRSKMWLPFGDEVMLQRITRILLEVAQPIVVVAALDQELPDLHPDILICHDDYPDKGPLSGIHTGLKRLNESGVDAAFVTACDCPFLKPELIRFLASHLDEASDLVLMNDGKYSHVLSAIYRTRLYAAAQQLLEKGQLRPIGLCDLAPVKTLGIEEARLVDPELVSLLNLNSPEDYELALSRLNKESPPNNKLIN